MTKYLIHIGICGFGNQLLGFKEACIIAKYTNRKIILPIFIPHGTIRNNTKEYYEFAEIFDKNNFNNIVESVNILDIANIKINNIYNIRNTKEKKITDIYYNYQKNYYKLYNIKFNYIKKQYIKSYDDFDELKNIKDEVLVLLGTFNNVILSNCYKNGCINTNCTLNKCFVRDYNEVTKSIIFNKYIENIAYKYIESININIENLCVFHMRVLDNCNNKSFENSYNNYNEIHVFKAICRYLNKLKKSDLIENIFLMSPPQYKNINNLKIFNTNLVKRIEYNNSTNDKFILSLVELIICEKAKIFITSPTNTPNEFKIHTRSSFSLHTKNLRDLSNNFKHDTCISNIL